MLVERLEVPGDALNTTVDAVVDAVGAAMALDQEKEYRIRLVSRELLNNIVAYSDADHIEMSADLDSGRLTLVIDDNGTGFPYDELMARDVTRGDYLWSDCGRGIFLVRTISDSFRYNDKGNSVQVVLDLN